MMSRNALTKFKTDYSIACSGIAGPDGGTPEKPVGTVWVAISNFERTIIRKLQLGNYRERVIIETSQHALNMLRKMLLEDSKS
jgi:nicotinamide-nucleotide amidase